MSKKNLTEEDLLYCFEGMYSDPDTDIREYDAAVVKTRKEHFCPGLHAKDGHTFPAGSRAVREKAIIDGVWRSAYSCERHVVDWAKQRGIDLYARPR